MTLQQLRYLREAARQRLNISDAARALATSQPGVSKQLRLLERELGVEIFSRKQGRIVELTHSGKKILAIAENVLRDTDSLKEIGNDFSNEDAGNLVIATTHTQARYALPEVLKRFAMKYPKVTVQLRQGNSVQVSQMVLEGNADIGIATKALGLFQNLVVIPCHRWERIVITMLGHPLQAVKPLTLEHIAKFPIISYGREFSARQTMVQTFKDVGLTPNIVLSALDADVIKACVALDLGVAILTQLDFHDDRDKTLAAIDASHLFESSTTFVGIRHGSFLRTYMYEFLEMFSPRLERKIVERALLE